MKIVLSKSEGYFDLSREEVEAYAAAKGVALYPEPTPDGHYVRHYWTVPENERWPFVAEVWSPVYRDASPEKKAEYDRYRREHTLELGSAHRTDPTLIELVEAGRIAGLRVVEIPDGVDWYVAGGLCACGDGCTPEYVAERHRTWGEVATPE